MKVPIVILLTETSGTGKETESSLGVLRVWAGGEMGREGFWFRDSSGEGDIPQQCFPVGWHHILNILNVHDALHCKQVILFKANNKQYTEHEKLK